MRRILTLVLLVSFVGMGLAGCILVPGPGLEVPGPGYGRPGEPCSQRWVEGHWNDDRRWIDGHWVRVCG